MEKCQSLSVNDLDSYYCDYCLAQYSDQDTSTVGDEPLNISTIELQEIEHLETEFATEADDRAAFSNEVDSDVVELIILSDAESTNGETTTFAVKRNRDFDCYFGWKHGADGQWKYDNKR